MTKTILAAALAVLGLALVPSLASASYYMSKGKAEANTRSYASENYASQYPGAYCRPQGLERPAKGYSYHRWVCTWVDEDKCEGRLLITGSRGPYYYARVLSGQRCPY